MTIWNPEMECMDTQSMRALQLSRLQETVRYTYENVPYYRDVFDQRGLHPDDIVSLEDIVKIPFSDKKDLRATYPYGLFAAPMGDIVRLHSSSGTTGKPVVAGYTKGDLDVWTECISRLVTMAGVTNHDVCQMAFLYGMFTGGWGLHYGLEKIGATVIPAGAGNTERHLEMMKDYGTTVLISTPSYALYLSETAQKLGYTKDDLKLRVGLFGGEPAGEALRRDIEKGLGITATSNYGLTEVMGPGVSGECGLAPGMMHIADDHFYAEVIDPDTGEVLPEGEYGELVITPISKRGSLVLRYRTHDLTRIRRVPCACGRTTTLMDNVRHRSDDMLIVKGVNIFPSQVEDVLASVPGASSQYRIVVDRVHGQDVFELQLEMAEEMFVDSMADMETFVTNVTRKLNSGLGIKVKLLLKEPGFLERTQGKSKKVLDLRNV